VTSQKPKKKLTIDEKLAARQTKTHSPVSTFEPENETAAERKKRLAKQEVDSDIQNMKDLFDGINIHPRSNTVDSSGTSTVQENMEGMSGMSLKSKEDLDSLSAQLSTIMTQFQVYPIIHPNGINNISAITPLLRVGGFPSP
jgi:hypothetical protein